MTARLNDRWDAAKFFEVSGGVRRRVETLQGLGIDAESHLFPGLRHGFGSGAGTRAEG